MTPAPSTPVDELVRLRRRLLEQKRTLAGLTRRNAWLQAENTRLRRELAARGKQEAPK